MGWCTLLVAMLLAFISFEYLVKTPAPAGAVPGCLGIVLGIMIALGAIVHMLGIMIALGAIVHMPVLLIPSERTMNMSRDYNSGGLGSIGEVAKSINQKSLATNAPPSPKLGEHLDALTSEIEMMNVVLGRVRNICDALTGSRPREASSNAAQAPAEPGLVGLAIMRRAQLRYIGEAIHAELDDIERVL